jgi:hypothetical protein
MMTALGGGDVGEMEYSEMLQSYDALNKRIDGLKSTNKIWSWPICNGRELTDEETPVPEVNQPYEFTVEKEFEKDRMHQLRRGVSFDSPVGCGYEQQKQQQQQQKVEDVEPRHSEYVLSAVWRSFVFWNCGIRQEVEQKAAEALAAETNSSIVFNLDESEKELQKLCDMGKEGDICDSFQRLEVFRNFENGLDCYGAEADDRIGVNEGRENWGCELPSPTHFYLQHKQYRLNCTFVSNYLHPPPPPLFSFFALQGSARELCLLLR